MTAPDILFIVLDTQRADRLGCYGHDRPTSPQLDSFAAQGALFEQAVAPAQWTVPSHASMFTGLYPTAHQVLQSRHSLSAARRTVTERLRSAGYETVGFCNNPLVGVLNNGLKRGFDTFYNYGGAIPSVPQRSSRWPWPMAPAAEAYTQFLRRISYPIQNFFGQSDLAFRLSLNAWLTPLWSRLANFKGQNERSVDDVCDFLGARERADDKRPLFLFLNLMETHLPFFPPRAFVDQFAPYVRRDRTARAVMRNWNREAYRWASPLAEPLSDLEAQILSDMYDAEVAYQDAYLGRLFERLASRRRWADTLTIIVSDHGDGLGEHGFMGHAFVAYEELVHVPLLLHWPARIKPGRVAAPVSTRRVFHTMLAAAGWASAGAPARGDLVPARLRGLSLVENVHGRDPEQGTAYAEVYPPLNFARAIQQRQPELLARHRCLETRRAVVRDGWKLIHVDDEPDELFDLAGDPAELDNRLATETVVAADLDQRLRRSAEQLQIQQSAVSRGEDIDYQDNEQLRRRLHGLGYIE